MITITCTAHEGLALTQNGETVYLAVVDKHGKILASGADVEDAVEKAAQGSHLNFLKARGHEVVSVQLHEHTGPAPWQPLAVPRSRAAA